MPTLLVVVVLVPAVVHCARASPAWSSVAASASRQSAAARVNVRPGLGWLVAVIIFTYSRFVTTRGY
jgi:hypothetical protein